MKVSQLTIRTFKRHSDKYMDRKGFGGIWARQMQMALAQLSNLVSMDELGRRACTCVLWIWCYNSGTADGKHFLKGWESFWMMADLCTYLKCNFRLGLAITIIVSLKCSAFLVHILWKPHQCCFFTWKSWSCCQWLLLLRLLFSNLLHSKTR